MVESSKMTSASSLYVHLVHSGRFEAARNETQRSILVLRLSQEDLGAFDMIAEDGFALWLSSISHQPRIQGWNPSDTPSCPQGPLQEYLCLVSVPVHRSNR